jgi:ceramide glucosyltransferase
MIAPLPGEMLVFCAAAGTAQLLFTLRFFLRFRSPSVPSAGRPPFSVSVVVPCKGTTDELDANVRSLLEQDYPGEIEYIFVVPSRGDAAFGRLESLLAKPGAVKARLIVSEAVPVRCSEKILNLLCGCRHVRESSEILLFADSDLNFPPGWAAGMVRPLLDPRVAVSTAHALPAPVGLPGEVMWLWTAAGIVYLDSLGVISGNSMAISKKDFIGLEVERAWSSSLCEDLTLSRLVKRAGRKICFPAAAIPAVSAPGDLGRVFSVSNKWMVYFRFYAGLIWLSGAALTGFKYYALWWSLSCGTFAPLLFLLAADFLNLTFLSRIFEPYGNRYPGNRAGGPAGGFLNAVLRRFACVAVLQLVYAANFTTSALRREVDWGGYRYRLYPTGLVEVISG